MMLSYKSILFIASSSIEPATTVTRLAFLSLRLSSLGLVEGATREAKKEDGRSGTVGLECFCYDEGRPSVEATLRFQSGKECCILE